MSTRKMVSQHDTGQMLQWVQDLSSPDPRIRDDVALAGLAESLLGTDRVPDDIAGMIHDAATAQDRGPFATLGDVEGADSAFGRSFGIELLAILHNRNNTSPFLSAANCAFAVSLVERFAAQESDFRAFAEDKGWVHVVAHVADLADEVLCASWLSVEDGQRVVEALALLVARAPRLLAGGEEDRVALALAGALGRGQISPEGLRSLAADAVDIHPASVRRRNWTMVVRSLWFRAREGLSDDAKATLLDLESDLAGLG